MISEIVMPQMGADMKEGTILRWLKREGDKVERGETIAEIETDKANIEIEAFDSGVFRKVLESEGAVVPVGSVIAVIAGAEDDISKYVAGAASAAAVSAAPPATETATSPPAAAASAPTPTAAPVSARAPAPASRGASTTSEGRMRVSPVARRMAEEAGIDLGGIEGSGPDGRIVLRDIEAAKAAGPARAATAGQQFISQRPSGEDIVEEVPLSRMRQTIARRMVQSKQEAPHYYLTIEVDMTEAMAFRAAANKVLGDKARISINDVIILAAAKTAVQHPRFNAWWTEDRYQLHSQVNIGIAVSLDEGLVVPAIFDCANKGLVQISQEARDAAERARSGRLKPEEYAGPTFSISNLGAFGVDTLTPIINPPQVAVLGIGAVTEKPVVRDGAIVIRSMMNVVLAADHRATDGAEGARMLQTLRHNLESPGMMLL